jgi:glucosamine--fructose-6-phosphate aminotransferase (isomerizing)
MIEELIPQEIHETPAAIRATIKQTHPEAQTAAAAIRTRSPRRIYLIGNGTSLYSSMAASYTARMLAGADDPLVLAVPAGDFRYYTPALNAQDVVVGVSASGEFRDVLNVFERLKGKCLTVGITHVPGSSITRISDYLLYSGGGPSRVPVMTKTYASTLTAIHLLLMEFFHAPQSYYDDLAGAVERTAAAIEEAEVRVPQIVAELSGFEHAFYFGAGNAYAAALEGALKMKEMAILHAEGSETWEMASGPATVVDKNVFCVALTTGDAMDEDTHNGAKHAREWGARLVEIGPRQVSDDLFLAAQAAQFACFSSLTLVPVAALLAYRSARARGYNPNHPAWRERYLSQGMSHIIGE